MEVMFTHPRDSKVFVADIEPECTGQQAVDGLIVGDEAGPFLTKPPQGRPYGLVVTRTKRQIPPNMNFGAAKVVDGDVIDIVQDVQGA